MTSLTGRSVYFDHPGGSTCLQSRCERTTEEDWIGTIPILRQQKDWVGGSRKWPVLLMFDTICTYADKVGEWVGYKKAKNMMTQYRDGP